MHAWEVHQATCMILYVLVYQVGSLRWHIRSALCTEEGALLVQWREQRSPRC